MNREKTGRRSYLNRADSSSNPLANAKTASREPSFLNANIARYLSNKDNLLSSNTFSNSGIEADEEEEEGRAADFAASTKGE
jgi:hypothetical protein